MKNRWQTSRQCLRGYENRVQLCTAMEALRILLQEPVMLLDVQRALTETDGQAANTFVRMTSDLENQFDSLLAEFMRQLLYRSLFQVYVVGPYLRPCASLCI